MTDRRDYFSVRTGRLEVNAQMDLQVLRKCFVSTYSSFENRGFFQEHLGTNCVDGYIQGKVGDLETYAFIKLRRDNLFPIWRRQNDLCEDEIFDLIEFLFDHASEPVGSGRYHDWHDCGYHCSHFKKGNAPEEFRGAVNEFLKDFGEGFELSKAGEILVLPDRALEPLLHAPVPAGDPANVTKRVDAAVLKFRRWNATEEERRDAIRDLADVLEFLRPQLKGVLDYRDERDIFNIANNFGIRHHNPQQKTNYDKAVWFSWIFYFYLATIHAALRLIQKKRSK